MPKLYQVSSLFIHSFIDSNVYWTYTKLKGEDAKETKCKHVLAPVELTSWIGRRHLKIGTMHSGMRCMFKELTSPGRSEKEVMTKNSSQGTLKVNQAEGRERALHREDSACAKGQWQKEGWYVQDLCPELRDLSSRWGWRPVGARPSKTLQSL